MSGIVKWHYIDALWAGPDDGHSDSYRGLVDGLLGRFGPGRLAHMQGASVVAPAKHRPTALRDIEVPPQAGQGALPDLVADAHGAEGEVPAIGTGTDASDEQDRTVPGCGVMRSVIK